MLFRSKRIVRVTITDLEANVPYSQDVTIAKTIERRQKKDGDTVITTRTNSYGDLLYILEATDDDWNFAFNLNARSQFWMIQQVIPRMLAQGGGSIINMASVCSSVRGLPNRFIYGSSKAAVIGLTKSVASDYVAKGIRCNCICPGTVDTPSLGDRINSYDDPEIGRAHV